jgi:hypothetical protein
VARKAIELGFDPKWVEAEIQKQPWERVECDREERRLFLGTVFQLYPSGKYYTGFACGNLAPCHHCGGAGRLSSRMPSRRKKKLQNWNLRLHERLGRLLRSPVADFTKAQVRRNLRQKEALLVRMDMICPRCRGEGSAEAHDDQVWHELAEGELDNLGLSLQGGEGDPCDLFAVESRDVVPEDGEEEECA